MVGDSSLKELNYLEYLLNYGYEILLSRIVESAGGDMLLEYNRKF